MRFLLFVCLFLSLPVAALADQHDPVLDQLFQELATGSIDTNAAIRSQIESRWAEAASPSIQLIYDRAIEAQNSGDERLSAELIGHVTRLAPSFAEGWRMKADILRRSGDRQAALKAYEKCLELEPRHYLASIAIGDLNFEAQQYRAALDHYQQAARWAPKFIELQDKLSLTYDLLGGREI
ncbi:MAG: tetratricopeptide repeat protein [bacterium]